MAIDHLRHFAKRQAPPAPNRLLHRLQKRFQEAYKRIWFVLSSLCQIHLWAERNVAVFRGELSNPCVKLSQILGFGLRQVKAIAIREHRSAATAVRGARLHVCTDELVLQDPRGHPPYAEISHDTLPPPALISWLRAFQTSCTTQM